MTVLELRVFDEVDDVTAEGVALWQAMQLTTPAENEMRAPHFEPIYAHQPPRHNLFPPLNQG